MALGLLLAYSSRFFNLVALLWSSSPELRDREVSDRRQNQDSMWGFIYLLFFISSVRVHQGTFSYEFVVLFEKLDFLLNVKIESFLSCVNCLFSSSVIFKRNQM
jgi:hypothetical protein